MVINSKEVDLNRDPDRLESYKCRVCNSWVIGDNKLLHEKVSVDDPLPIGFVYVFSPKKAHYFIVGYIAGKSKLELTEHKLITGDFSNKFYHGYNYNELSLVNRGGELHFLNASQKDSKKLRRFLSEETYNLLNDKELEIFKGLFEKVKKELPIGRINLKNLTNKL